MAPDLSLDLKLSTPKIISNLSRDSADDDEDPQSKISKIEHQIQNLEEERLKIEVFKRELPLCLYLLEDVIGEMREELEQCRRENIQAKFMPVKSNKLEKDGGVKLEMDIKDNKMNWMSSAQLWSYNYSDDNYDNNTKITKTVSKENTVSSPEKERLPDRSLTATKPIASCHVSLSQQPASRKARRCWSPELHRRFVDALQQLGGAQIATPKQIRELMKLDGLTNDEVKSHLQKYRLHARGVPPGQSGRAVVVMGTTLWSPQESNSHSGGSPQGPLQMTGSAVSTTTVGDSKAESYSWK